MSHLPQYVTPEFQTACLPAIAAGKTGKPEVITDGGVKGSISKIVFTGNIIAGDTITIGGVVFTAKASGAAGELEFNVDSTLALSLTALNTKLNACTNVKVSVATYSVTDTNTAITATLDSYGLSVVVASTHSTVVLTQGTGGKVANSISLDTEHTQVNWDTFTADLYLPDGSESQRKTISMFGSGTCNVVSAGDLLPGTTNNYALNGNDVLILQFLGGKWRLILNDGATAT